MLRYSRMLSGYIPSPSALTQVMNFVKKMKSINPDLLYLLDPVMGEMDRGFYVDKDCLPLYQQLVGMASIICPNQFEAEQLAEIKIDSISALYLALQRLHQKGSDHVIITSVNLTIEDNSNQEDMMVQVGSTRGSSPWLISFPEFKGYYVGVGDLFSALLLGRYNQNERGSIVDTPLACAAEKAIAGVQGVLRNTAAAIDATPPVADEIKDEAQTRVEVMRRRELRLIQSRQAIENPDIQHRARWLPSDP